MRLHLVCPGRVLEQAHRPVREWCLDPAGYDEVWALRTRLPRQAAWYCSTESAATETAQLLTDGAVGILEALGEDPVASIEPIVLTHTDEDVVLVASASILSAVAATVGGRSTDLERCSTLSIPDVISLEVP